MVSDVEVLEGTQMNLEDTFNSLDELDDEFTSSDFPIINEVYNHIKELKVLNKFDINDWNESIDEWYTEVYLAKKRGSSTYEFGYNDIQTHFVFYCLYKMLVNESKALEHIKLAHKFYKKNTLSYQWENVVYNAFREIYVHSVFPDCILPNNKKPDLAINPTYNKVKYHPRGTRIVKAEKIIDMKTSVYDISKERIHYKKFCDELIIVYIDNNKTITDENITFISAEELKKMVSKSDIIKGIEIIQMKAQIDYIVNQFENRFIMDNRYVRTT